MAIRSYDQMYDLSYTKYVYSKKKDESFYLISIHC